GAFVGAVIAGVFVIVGLTKGRFRPAFVPPLPGGSVYLETLVAFLSGFLALKVVLPLVLTATGVMKAGVEPPDWLTTFSLACQWLLLPLIFWPLLRGVSWERWRKDLGWHSGAGVWKEVGAGIYAYFGGLPLLALAAMITILFVLIRAAMAKAAGGESAPPVNPILEMLETASPWAMVLLFVLATVWAPLVEETLFRGGLFRHLRGRIGVLLSAVISAVWFGLMHSYELPLLLPVMTLGFVFALMREWRGSLIPSIVAHGLHNATVLSLAIGFFWVLR
ncbi:MAG: CPBP family intramembrane metalloprotease, partial [bacterium]|nr:CPBP family intramembrane metalloprotease [bacterium]